MDAALPAARMWASPAAMVPGSATPVPAAAERTALAPCPTAAWAATPGAPEAARTEPGATSAAAVARRASAAWSVASPFHGAECVSRQGHSPAVWERRAAARIWGGTALRATGSVAWVLRPAAVPPVAGGGRRRTMPIVPIPRRRTKMLPTVRILRRSSSPRRP
jgi:hypothetical protein